MAVLRVSVAHTLSGVAAILFELFGSFGTVFSGPLGRFLQPLLPVGVQTVSIIPWALLELHQLLRGTGGIGLHISRYPSRPVTGPFGTHWRTISSNSRRKLLPKEGFLHRSWETVLWSGTRSRRSSPSTSELGTLSAASSRGFGGTPTSIFAVQKRQVSIHLPCLILTCTPQTCGNAKNRIIFLSLMYSRILLQ